MACTGLIGGLRTILAPKVLPWPNITSAGAFVDLYDWDVLKFAGGTSVFSGTIQLCLSIFPCSLNVVGSGRGTIERTDGSISCLSSAGCEGVTFQSLNIECSGYNMPSQPLLIVQGSAFSSLNVSYRGCRSGTDGGVIKSYDAATLMINASRFENVRSLGFGGALVVLGSTAYISDTHFLNCSAALGGGAIWAVWAPVFQCYGTDNSDNTILHIDHSSSFTSCHTSGQGGSILVTLDQTTLSASFEQTAPNLNDSKGSAQVMFVYIGNTDFSYSKSEREGGALAVSSISATVEVFNSTFANCLSSLNGGAVFAGDEAGMNFSNVSFHGNSAAGLGGGAIFSQNARFSLTNIISSNNNAVAGGGGVLFWAGDSMPTFPNLCSSFESVWPTYNPYNIIQTTVCNGESQISASSVLDLIAAAICGSENNALYGQCIASDCKTVQSVYAPMLAYPGLPISIVALKKDAYNQTIISDSASVIQVFASTELRSESAAIKISGNTIVRFSSGLASISLAISPIFASIDFRRGITSLLFQPCLYLSGVDSQTSLTIQSHEFSISFQSGRRVCPGGYILDFYQPGSTNGSATCTFCKAGTYSVNPLAPQPDSASSAPSCMNCPLGGDCSAGGDTVKFAVGTWIASFQMYLLVDCPSGYQLVNTSADGRFSHALQECKPCLPGEYIIRPNVDSCQTCPAGKICLCYS